MKAMTFKEYLKETCGIINFIKFGFTGMTKYEGKFRRAHKFLELCFDHELEFFARYNRFQNVTYIWVTDYGVFGKCFINVMQSARMEQKGYLLKIHGKDVNSYFDSEKFTEIEDMLYREQEAEQTRSAAEYRAEHQEEAVVTV